MDGRTILAARIEELRRELKNAEETLRATADRELKERVEVRFAQVFAAQFRRLQALEEANAGPQGGPVEPRWAEFRDLTDESRELLAECLAFRVGELTRAAGLDDGLCAIADHLLVWYSMKAEVFWNRLTILDEAELANRLTQIIRLRFPASIWDLPFAAHEFGHFLGTRLADLHGDGPAVFPFRDMLAREVRDSGHPYAANHLRELFSDLFATYTLGPAYACAGILGRFDPTQKTFGSFTHPGDDARACAILRFLEQMDARREPYDRQYGTFLPDMKQAWADCRQAVPEQDAREDYLVRINAWADELLELFETRLRPLRFDDWRRCGEIAGRLAPPSSGRAEAEPSDEDTIPRLLNGIWYYRITHAGASAAERSFVADRARRLGLKLIRRK